MKLYPTFLCLFLLQFIGINGFSQNKVVLEQIQTFSTIHPTAIYWHQPSSNASLLNALDTGIFARLHLQRVASIDPINKIVSKQSQLGKIVVDWSKSRAYDYHAYLELYEMDPAFVYENKWVKIPESRQDSIHSIWYIACNIYNQKQEKLFGKTLLLSILPIHSVGMGYEITTTGSVPNNVFEGISKALSLLIPDMEDMDYLEAKMPVAYATDNYWMPLVHNQPRILFDTSKQFISYSNNGKLLILKIPEASLRTINIKDKSLDNPFKEIIGLIRKSKSFLNYNEYYQVIQPLRDVYDNIDYTLESYLEFNSEAINNGVEKIAPISFLQDSVHKIYQDKELIGGFMVKENSVEKNKYFYPDKVYNGYDSTKVFPLGTYYAKQPIVHARVIEGKILDHPFSIKINYVNNLKTISLDEKIIMVLEGKKKPAQMVLLDKNISNQLVNLLLLIAYSEIFQSPT
ncbi:MAG: hypothetical protein WCJ68_07790 [Chitinophagia bacterium]|jgi:hypothetical protein